MVNSQYQFALVSLDDAGQVLTQHALEVNWSPAVESVRWKGMREGVLASGELGGVPTIEPLIEDPNLPYVRGFRLTIHNSDEILVESDFGIDYFAEAASQAAQGNNGSQEETPSAEAVAYRIAAFPLGRKREEPSRHARFHVHEVAAPLPVREADIESLMRVSESHGQHEDDDVQVFVPVTLLQETADHTVSAGEHETGGILLGGVYRDRSNKDLFLVVTAQIPAEHTESTSTRLTFTPRTWAAAQSALELRKRGEIMLGWWHTHLPRYWCKDCPKKKREKCPLKNGFFSAADRRLHETVFPRANSLALVETYGEGLQHDLYSWRHGRIHQRGFRILHADQSEYVNGTAQPIGDTANA